MLRRIRTWLRRHPRLVDGAWVVPLLAGSAVAAVQLRGDETQLPSLVLLALVFCLCVPLVFRRERPALVFAVISLTAFVQWLLGSPSPMMANVALLPALYTVASRCSRTLGVLAGLVMLLGSTLASARWGPGPAAIPISLLPEVAFFGAIVIAGMYMQTRRAYLASLVERAKRLEQERDSQAQIAAAAERARIAREMHDVIAHSLSVMVVQADGAGYALGSDPDRAHRAMETISSTGRQALTEMRQMLGILREDSEQPGKSGGTGGSESTEYAPQPGVEQLDDLVERVRGAGLPVEFTVEGTPLPLPSGMQLVVYRVVQEALTNTLKHAGASASGAAVSLRFGRDVLELQISDDGRGAAAMADGHGEEGDATPRGHGLIGMRERVAVYAGSVHTGPRTGGGYEVVASLPLRQTTQ